MKKFLVTLLVSALFFAVSCGSSDSKEKKEVVEEKSQTISAAEGGEIEVAGGEAKVKIPAGALDKDLEISMTLYKTDGFNNKNALAANVVEFGPAGTVFKKPIIVTINAGKAVKGKTIAAAVMKSDGTWSYSKKGAYAILEGFEATGDPIMISATGDPIMLSATGDPIMMDADGNKTSLSATGDPIMLMATGDPIMTNATGDPIMNAATGDPIMMTTGHFSSYTFVVVDEVKEEENSNNNHGGNGGGKTGEVTCKTVKEWDTLYGDEEDADYDDKEDSSIYCQKTGEMLVYCIYGDSYGAYSDLYSIKVGDKEFKCESENNEDCVFGMEQYCEALDGEYEDGFFCKEQGKCSKTGETAKNCVSTKGDESVYLQAGDRKFECNEDDMQSCYDEFYEYCGETNPEDDYGDSDPEDETDTGYDEDDPYGDNQPEECSFYTHCEGGNFNIYLCYPEEGDTYIFYSGYKYDCADPEEGKDRCEQELDNFAESCSY